MLKIQPSSLPHIEIPVSCVQLIPFPKNIDISNSALKISLHSLGKYKLYPDYEDIKKVNFINMGRLNRHNQRIYCIKPDIRYYQNKDFVNALKNWNKLKKSTEHIFSLEIRHCLNNRIEFWIDGRFLFKIELIKEWRNLIIKPNSGAKVITIKEYDNLENIKYLKLFIPENNHQRNDIILKNLKINNTEALLNILIEILPLNKQIDVGISRWLTQSLNDTNLFDLYYRG